MWHIIESYPIDSEGFQDWKYPIYRIAFARYPSDPCDHYEGEWTWVARFEHRIEAFDYMVLLKEAAELACVEEYGS